MHTPYPLPYQRARACRSRSRSPRRRWSAQAENSRAVLSKLSGLPPIAARRREGLIPPEVLQQIFEPFQRGPASDGLGLGLYIARQIVVAHEGTLHVRSTEAEGTTVVARLGRTAS